MVVVRSPVFVLDSLSPPSGASIDAASTFRAVVHHCVGEFQPGMWRAVVLFETTEPGRLVSGPTVNPGADALRDMTDERRSTSVLDLGPYEYTPRP